MSVFGKLFGGNKGEKPQTTGEAIQNLRETEEMLMKKQDFLEKKIEGEMVTARKVRKFQFQIFISFWEMYFSRDFYRSKIRKNVF